MPPFPYMGRNENIQSTERGQIALESKDIHCYSVYQNVYKKKTTPENTLISGSCLVEARGVEAVAHMSAKTTNAQNKGITCAVVQQ